MCGIVAVRGRHAASDVLTRLKGLEYRGYDSAGVAALSANHTVHIARSVGPADALIERLTHEEQHASTARLAIGHTCWASHGAVAVRNAHPLSDCDRRVTVVHNGVLDNAASLRAELEGLGHRFESAVDSEVIPHLIEQGLKTGATPFEAFGRAVSRLRGSWAIAALIARSNSVFVARQRSPLMVRGTVGRFVAASDVTATAGVRGPLRLLDDGTVAELGTEWRWGGLAAKGPAPVTLARPVPAGTSWPPRSIAQKGGGAAVTADEIDEQRELVERLVTGILDEGAARRGAETLGMLRPHRVILLGCGTSFHAARVTARTLRLIAGIDARAVIASEFDAALVPPFDVTVAISQSGETAEVLTALDRVSTPVVAITNSVHSSVAHRADMVIDCHAGVHPDAAATKTLTSQVLCGTHFALSAARTAGRTLQVESATALLATVPERFSAALDRRMPATDADLRSLAAAPGWLFVATGAGLPYAAEGALKLKELSYRWADCVATAELKHGALALVSAGTPAVLIDDGSPRSATGRAELTARGATVIAIGPQRPTSTAEYGREPPWGPIEAVPTLQYLALAVADSLGRNIDRPRNIATSVTVS